MKLITTILISGALLISTAIRAQVDDVKMTKDLRVASKVLETLTQGDDHLMMYSDNVEGNYIEGYGVIFGIGGGYSVFMKQKGKYAYSIRTGSGSGVVVSPQIDTEVAAKAEAAEKAEIEARAEADHARSRSISGGVFTEENGAGEDEAEIDFEKIMLEFLVDYSQMINQLKPTDKILVSTKKSDYMYVSPQTVSVSEGEGHGITAELLKKDHNDYMSGKINRKQLITKIKINKHDGSTLRSKDLDLFSSMLKTIYDPSYTDTYFISWKPDYERIKGVGAIYSFKVYSSYDDNGLYRMPGIDKAGLSAVERNKNVEELYPVFVESMKENIIQYGRTINSLEPNEMVLLKITLTKCDDCSIPKKIQFSVKQEVLAAFNSGKLSQKEAIAKVKMKGL